MKDDCDKFLKAADQIVARCREMQDCTLGAATKLSRLFVGKELEKNVDLSLDFLHATAELKSADHLARLKSAVLRIRKAVLETDELIAERAQANPAMVSSVIASENTFFELLLKHDPTVCILASLVVGYERLIRSFLTAIFVDIGRQLAKTEGTKIPQSLSVKALAMSAILMPQIKEVLEEAVARQERSLSNTRREILKSIREPIDEDFTIVGPKTPEQRALVRAVVCHIAEAKAPVTFYKASQAVFRKLPNGYSSAHVLEKWCNRNADKMKRWISSYRLGQLPE